MKAVRQPGEQAHFVRPRAFLPHTARENVPGRSDKAEIFPAIATVPLQYPLHAVGRDRPTAPGNDLPKMRINRGVAPRGLRIDWWWRK